jgi:hypothetical protein
MEDDAKREKYEQLADEDSEVEGHKYEPEEAKREKYDLSADDDEDLEADKV